MTNELLGIGLYSISEASRLSGVSSQRIRRWVCGYNINTGKSTKKQAELWAPDVPKLNNTIGLSFMDLMEVRFIDEFRNLGVSWKTIRAAVEYAANEMKEKHPLCSKKFVTDKRKIFDSFGKNSNNKMIDTQSMQYQFADIIKPTLHKGLEFNQLGIAQRWWPNANKKDIVLDPSISFGKPIVNECFVPTEVLFRSYKAEEDIKRVASIYDVKTAHVRSAIEFEQKLAA